MASASFGTFAGDLLVGNFGDGHINAYDRSSGTSLAEHRSCTTASSAAGRRQPRRPLEIDGLWALQFAQGGNNGTAGTLYFTAGPNGEADGLFGRIKRAESRERAAARSCARRRPYPRRSGRRRETVPGCAWSRRDASASCAVGVETRRSIASCSSPSSNS